jgi:probable F420-dependent oxidoreductase
VIFPILAVHRLRKDLAIMAPAAVRRLGTNLPLQGVPLAEHRPVLDRLRAAGLTDVWTGEYNRVDGALPLALVAGWDDSVNIVSAILNVATRGPALLAMTVAGLGDLAPGRATIGLGTSSVVPVEQWNGMSSSQPYLRMRETLEFLDDVLAGKRSTGGYATIRTTGFQLADRPKVAPRIGIAGLGPRMQRLAASHADSLSTGFLTASDVTRVRANVERADRNRSLPFELLVGVFIQPAGNEADVNARRCITQYFNTPPYAAQQRWLGRGEVLGPMWERWAAGDRRGALAAIPPALVDELIVSGDPQECAGRIAQYFDAGVTGVNLMMTPAVSPMSAHDQVTFLAAVAAALRAI